MLKRLNMMSCTPTSTPAEVNLKLVNDKNFVTWNDPSYFVSTHDS